jgi:nitrogen fixation NifU-like protein
MDRSRNPQYAGSLQNPDLIGEGANPFCGDEVHLEIKLENEFIQEVRHTTRACAVCGASIDLLAEEWIGKSLETVLATTPDQITEMLGIPLSPVRLKCALLPLETLRTAAPTH